MLILPYSFWTMKKILYNMSGGWGGGGGGNSSIQEETMRMVQLLASFSAGAVTNNYLPNNP